MRTSQIPAMNFHNSKFVSVGDIELSGPTQSLISLSGKKSEQITLPGNSGTGQNFNLSLGEMVIP
ncbi:MAG: hypothetical protein V3V53_03680 [Bacteroidales bacterium]